MRLGLWNFVDLETYLKNVGVWYRFYEKPETVHTVDASRVTGIELNRITKNLVCRMSDGRFALLVVAGDRKVNLQSAAKVLGVRNIQLLEFDEAEPISGYPPGGTPSVHHRTPLQVVIDKQLLTGETVFCGGGTRSRLLELRVADILKLSSALTGSISQ